MAWWQLIFLWKDDDEGDLYVKSFCVRFLPIVECHDKDTLCLWNRCDIIAFPVQYEDCLISPSPFIIISNKTNHSNKVYVSIVPVGFS